MNQFSSLFQERFLFVSVNKRLLFILLFFFIVNVGFSQTVCSSGQIIQTDATNGAPTIDGAVDATWGNVLPNSILNGVTQGTQSGDNASLPSTTPNTATTGYAAQWRAKWDNTNLYILVQVIDNTWNPYNGGGTQVYNFDAIELYLSRTHDANCGSYAAGDAQYFFSSNTNGAVVPVTSIGTAGSGTSTTGIQFASKAIVSQPFGSGGAGYNVEIILPWTAIGFVSAPAMDYTLGMDIGVDDNNNSANPPNSSGGDYRDEQFEWHTTSSNDFNCPSNFAAVPLTAPPSLPHAGSPQTICANSSATLAATTPAVGIGTWSVNVGGPSTSSAQFGNIHSPTSNFTPAGSPGLYRLLWTVANNPCTTTNPPDTVNITVNAVPFANINVGGGGSSGTICYAGDTTIGFTGTPNATVTYTINSGSNQTIILNNAGIANLSTGALNGSTTYSLVSVTNGTCSQNQSGSAVITLQALPLVNAGVDSLISIGTTFTFQGTTNTSGTYAWTDSAGTAVFVKPDSLDAQVTPTTTDNYILTVTSGLGCVGTDSVRISVTGTCFHPYNAFTPNGDGINDLWAVYDAAGCFTSIDANVYNRWGALVYHQDNYQNTWDGTYKGKQLPDGTYYYSLIVHFTDGRVQTVTGNVSIIR
jgi:gliding motility-associated-like protein